MIERVPWTVSGLDALHALSLAALLEQPKRDSSTSDFFDLVRYERPLRPLHFELATDPTRQDIPLIIQILEIGLTS